MILRARSLLCVFVFCLASFACGGEPPTKEMQDAQTAIDAAKAAGADTYAPEEFNAAQEALRHAKEAVDQRDFRLALNDALDSRERAQNALSEAAGKRAAAKADADEALRRARIAVRDIETRVADMDTRANARALAAPKTTLATAQRRLQEASTAFAQDDFAKSAAASRAALDDVSAVTTTLDAVTQNASRRRR
jgi:hypothetical protein